VCVYIEREREREREREIDPSTGVNELEFMVENK
jgi:hypothetical protein